MKLPTSSACSPRPGPDAALSPSKQPPARPSSPVGQLSLPMRQLLPLRPACCSKISLTTTTMTETFHRSAFPFAHELPRACQSAPSTVAEGLDLHFPCHKHTWRLASIKTVNAWRLPSTTALCQWTSTAKKEREKKTNGVHSQMYHMIGSGRDMSQKI